MQPKKWWCLFFCLVPFFVFGQEKTKGSFENSVGKNAAILDAGSFRFGLGIESKNANWQKNDYSSMVVPFHLSVGVNSNIEINTGVLYNKAFSDVDGSSLKDKMSFHNLYGGMKYLLNPSTAYIKPSYGLWMGSVIPLHSYECFIPEARFLISSGVKELFSWNFNLGFAYGIGKWKKESSGEAIYPGGKVLLNIEIGYKLLDFLKFSTAIDSQAHFWMKKELVNGVKEEIEDFIGWRWLNSVRFKPGDLPLVIDGGIKIGLTKKAEDSFSFFLQIQLIPDSANAAW